MPPLCSGVLQDLLLVSAVVHSVFWLSTSSIKQCEVPIPQKVTESSVTFRNIGIRLCQVRCIETGGCLRFEYNSETLTCCLRLGEPKRNETTEGFIVLQKNHSDVPTGPCAATSCSLGSRCLESRSGKAVCLKDEKLYHLRSHQHKRNQKRNTLHEACREGDLGQVRHALTEAQEDINSREDEDGMTPVLLAARGGYRDVFMLCVCAGGNVSVVDPGGNNILHWACIGGNVAVVKYILSQNITDINSRGKYRRTPLMMAALKGYRDVFDLLVSKGGDALLVDADDENILHLACIGGRVEMVKYILSQNIADINSKGKYRRTPLMMAALKGYRDVFDLLVSKGGDALLVDADDENILHLACIGGRVEMVKYILSQNIADINSRGKYRRTPLMNAVGHRDVFDLLVMKGDNASLVDKFGDNVLHIATLGGDVEVVEYVLSNNIADVNSRGIHGRTPLMVAAGAGYRNVFDLLVNRGGNASAVDDGGSNILHVACFFGKVKMVMHIISHDIVEISSRGIYGRTPLMIASGKGNIELFDFLVSKGGNMSVVDENNDTILHIACLEDHVEMVKHILSQSAVDIKARNKYGLTAAMTAKNRNSRESYVLLMKRIGEQPDV